MSEKKTTWLERLISGGKTIDYSWSLPFEVRPSKTAFQMACEEMWGPGKYYHGEKIGDHHWYVTKYVEPIVINEWKLLEKKVESGRDVKHKVFNQKQER